MAGKMKVPGREGPMTVNDIKASGGKLVRTTDLRGVEPLTPDQLRELDFINRGLPNAPWRPGGLDRYWEIVNDRGLIARLETPGSRKQVPLLARLRNLLPSILATLKEED